ncbi:MAG: histone deacetylase [Vicinamibacterales bacterium]
MSRYAVDVMALTLISSTRFADHITPPGHPERPERAETMDVVVRRWCEAGGAVHGPRAATDEDLLRVHSVGHVSAITALRGRAAMLDPDTFTSPESESVARLAAGAVLDGVDAVMTQPPGARAMALIRPPGHHAERERAMGFCLFNSIACGAAYARSRGIARVAIVDYDVHHGNGSQSIFYEDPTVLFISTHQYPFYPGTGAADETGRGEGDGTTVNVPLEVGATDADYDLVFDRVVIPVLHEFRPELLLVSAGFDAHERDPLAGMRMTTSGYGRLTGRLLEAADALCNGRAVFVTEGGYDPSALHDCLTTVVGLAAETVSGDASAPPAGETKRGAAATRTVTRAQSRFWKL